MGWSNRCVTCAKRRVAVAARPRPLDYADTPADVSSAELALRTIRPTFVGWTAVVKVMPIALFMTVWAGGFVGGILTGLLHAVGLAPAHWPVSPFVLIGAMAFFGIPSLTYFGKRSSYARTQYRVYADRVEALTPSFTMSRQTVYLRDVRRVDLACSTLQRHHALGTVKLITGIEPPKGKAPAQELGLHLKDIANAEEVYAELQRMVGDAKRSAASPMVPSLVTSDANDLIAAAT